MSRVNDKNKSDKKKNLRGLNIGIIVCSIILVYLIIRFCTYFLSNNSSLYEVVTGTTEGRFNAQYTALALRSESVINSTDTGYINFFVGDATPISVGEQVCVIDESGELSQRLEEASRNQTVLNENDLNKIQGTIYDFDTSYNPDNYYDTYYFKYKIESQILDLINSSVFDTLNSGVSSASTGSYQIGYSDIAGIIQHSYDGFESYTLDDVEASMFRRTNYNKTIIKSNDLVDSGSPIYKVVTSEDWYLIIQLNDEDNYDDIDTVTIDFLSDGVETEAAFSTMVHAGSRYGVIELSKYLIRYISDRYIQIKIVSDSVSGLSVPISAVGEEQFYIIPVEFMTQGGDSSDYGFLKQVINSDGSTSVQFTNVNIVKTTDEYAYVSTSELEAGDILIHPDTNAQYKITAKENLQGVYVSTGSDYYTFEIINILGENNGYYIISSDDGVRQYDQILKKASNYDK